MRHLLIIPIVLSALALGAHLLRGGSLALALAAAALPLLLLLRSPAALRWLQGLLFLGALEWLRTLAAILQVRRAVGEPWLRMAVILGAVAAVTLLAALAAGRWHRGRRGAAPDRAGALPVEAA